MDVSEATKIVMSRLRNLDLENASRIMGYILIRDRGEQEMIMLALGSDAVLLSYVNQAKAYFDLNSANSIRDASKFAQSSPRVLIPSDALNYSGNPSSPASYRLSSPSSVPYGAAVLSNVDSQFYGGDDDVDAFALLQSSRRCQPVNDSIFPSYLEEGDQGVGFEKRPCSYYARGFCKNGSSCKFLHDDNVGDEFLKLQEQRLPQMASRNRRPSSSAYNKSINFLNENQRRGPRNERAQSELEAAISSRSRQIYLTFPHESSFTEEDVSNYFAKFGLVHDVRIPHQPKRMFGFVTFAHPETVKRILAKGNPHTICDCRVLVKPYIDKGKFAENKHLENQYQNTERIEEFDPPIGSRMLFSREMVNLEQKMRLQKSIELQQTIELERRRMMELQLHQQDHRFPPIVQVGPPNFSTRGFELLKGDDYVADSHDIFEDFDDESCFLPDNLLSSPTKSASEHQTEEDNGASPFGMLSPR